MVAVAFIGRVAHLQLGVPLIVVVVVVLAWKGPGSTSADPLCGGIDGTLLGLLISG